LGRATVFRESVNITLPQDVPVTLAGPGRPVTFGNLPQLVPTGRRVDSYFIHFAVPRNLRRTAEVLVAEGKIRFGRPIAGVIAASVSQTTELAGNPSTEYPGDRWTGLNANIDGDVTRGDHLEVSDDRKTLSFRLQVHGREGASQEDFTDQIRVLVAAD
ncbi:MAG: hypothetical protein KDA89_02115, partial [Planctomycetaceae bacterium]|nr:hypothetical protein [Planctomycetaceae bacterium]